MSKKKNEEILDMLVQCAYMYQKASKDDMAISICDKEKWLLQLNSKSVSLSNKAGDLVSKDDPVIQSALKGEGVAGRPPYELYDMHFFGKATPILNDSGEVIGAMGMAYNIESLVKLEETIEKLNDFSKKINEHMFAIVSQSEQLSATTTQLSELSENAKESSDDVNNVLTIIKNISSQTNMLGLNANIEAARAGEFGKGFSVVADEIRNLSKKSADSSDLISHAIYKIKSSINDMSEGLQEIKGLTDEQTKSIEEFKDMLSVLNDIIDLLNEYIRDFS